MNKDQFNKVVKAYKDMALEGKYRPCAPGDGLGGVYLTEEQLEDPEILQKEAEDYAKDFSIEENTGNFYIGISDFVNLAALVYTIEAAKNLCAGRIGQDVALKLLEMAAMETQEIIKKYTSIGM
jgi:hypothetical protein